MPPAAAVGAIPFAGAALPYREQFFTTNWTPTTAAQNLSPPGNAIKSYGFARALRLYTTVGTAGAGGNFAADSPWAAYSNIQVTQPNGEELYGGPTWSGYHAYLAAVHSAWKLNNDPATWDAYNATSPTITTDLPIPFEINPQYGLGSLPNQDFSAPWKLTLTGNTIANIWTTAPTTTPTFTSAIFLDAWTVPAAQNPLNGQPQQVQPVYLGTLSKWTLQSYTIPAASAYEVPFSRRGNAYRRLVFTTRGAANARVAITNFPNPIALRWDGTVVRTNDNVNLWRDDEYMIRGGSSGSTPVTNQVGVVALSMAALAGADFQGAASSLGEEPFWGTVQSSTVTLSGTWGASVTLLEQCTNDVQLVDLTGNPYQFSGGTFLQAPAQPSVRP
jgi:hypothetical protein